MIFKNLLKIFSSKYGIIWFLIWSMIILTPTYFFTWSWREQLVLWMWDIYFYSILFLDLFLAFLFAIFVWATLYKMTYFWNKKASKLWFLWWFLGALVWGCASCSLTLASVLWLWAFISFLPYGWLELKILSIFLLLYVCFTTLKNLWVCNIKF